MELISYLVTVCYKDQHSTLFVLLLCYRGSARELVFYLVCICLQTLCKGALVALLFATEVEWSLSPILLPFFTEANIVFCLFCCLLQSLCKRACLIAC